MRLNQVTLPCTELDASVAFYKKLGFLQLVASPHYARFQCPEGDATLSLHVHEGEPRPGEAAIYLECDALDATVARLQREGVRFESEPTDQSWLWREAWLRDPYGNRVCLFFAGKNRLDPPWRLK